MMNTILFGTRLIIIRIEYELSIEGDTPPTLIESIFQPFTNKLFAPPPYDRNSELSTIKKDHFHFMDCILAFTPMHVC